MVENFTKEFSEFESKLAEANQVFRVRSDEIKDENVVDLTQIIEKFDLKNFDKNLKYTSREYLQILDINQVY